MSATGDIVDTILPLLINLYRAISMHKYLSYQTIKSSASAASFSRLSLWRSHMEAVGRRIWAAARSEAQMLHTLKYTVP